MRGPGSAIVLAALLAAGCGSTAEQHSAATAPPSVSTAAKTSKPGTALVGRWALTRTCEGMVAALKAEHLGALAPAVVGEYFPGRSARELARKRELCAGAKPTRHSHFFDAQGQFGSLDENGEQVDDGSYRATADSFVASHLVAVALAGHAWKRVACDNHC